MTIRFETSDNRKLEGELVEDIGHAILVKVTKGRKNIVGRTMLFSKAHMIRMETAAR